MRTFILTLLAISLSVAGMTQDPHPPCGILHELRTQHETNPAYIEGMARAEAAAQKWLEENPMGLKNDGELTIPVVFHIIYSENDSANQSIPDAMVHSQMEILNAAYRAQNENASQTRPIFDSLHADMKINFALASIDPEGNASTGIYRYPTSEDGFDILFNMNAWKHSSTGGADAWPSDLYLNVWVAKMTMFGMENSLLGIATFPSTMSAEEGNADPAPFDEDGISLNYNHVGDRTETSSLAPSNRGKTMIHEVGHWLGLRHIWADEDDPFTGNPGSCSADDYVNDTPMCNQRSQGTCDLNRNSCSNEDAFGNTFWGTIDPPDMIENYMDYSDEGCMTMFTHGQKKRAWSFLVTARKKLFESNGRNGEHFNAYAVKTESSCPQECDGSIQAYAYWGEAPYTYRLDGVEGGPLFEQVCTGVHQLEVEDNAGTIVEATVTLVSNRKEMEIELTLDHPTCPSCADGTATASLLNGTPDYSFEWNTTPPQFTATASGLSEGTYTVTITDGCGVAREETVEMKHVGIAEYRAESLVVYPNPARDELFVEGKAGLRYQLKSLLGAAVQQGTIGNNGQIDLRELQTGMYYLRVDGGQPHPIVVE